MPQVSRKNNLRIPKQIDLFDTAVNTVADVVATKQGVAMAHDEKFQRGSVIKQAEQRDKELDHVMQLPFNANDLVVVTVVKKLGAYVIAVTEKSPAKFRGVFVNRMQNYCLETLECLLRANFIRMDSLEHKVERDHYQQEAIVKLKLLAYIAMVAETSGCILRRQYKQISIQVAEAIHLVTAWKKSDDDRYRKRHEGF